MENGVKESIVNKLYGLSPQDLFFQMFDNGLLSHIVKESVKYAHENNSLDFSLTVPLWCGINKYPVGK